MELRVSLGIFAGNAAKASCLQDAPRAYCASGRRLCPELEFEPGRATRGKSALLYRVENHLITLAFGTDFDALLEKSYESLGIGGAEGSAQAAAAQTWFT